jgi:predicted nucleic acid-binding protein
LNDALGNGGARTATNHLLIAGGRAKNSTRVAALADANVLVYAFDFRAQRKQAIARRVLQSGLPGGDRPLTIPHQALIEFVAAVTKPTRQGPPLLPPIDAWHEMEMLLSGYPVLYPTDEVLRAAVRGASLHRLSWFDANIWAYAETYGLTEILTEDFKHGRLYGNIRATNPFLP